ncbi:tyrosine kinase [Schistosoma mansoni]|uniref:tyrosine kinase n=1 Tax=Schistosoma mansoni TaxID=6183 RepID=UPI0001A64199|nr:tyrosine kinase [Schistosoma mansoni]|eukprot:XP_018645841.1 tyrosine kinase [Schistosoma mansoni]
MITHGREKKFRANVFVYLRSFSCAETPKPKHKLISAPIGDRVVLSCGIGNSKYRVYEWLDNEKPMEFAIHNVTMHSNGSIDFRIRMENADRIFSCLSYNSYPNGTQDSLLIFVYNFVPIVKAFLAETVHNTTVDWGSIYRFPCIFGGTDPRDDTMILNNQIVVEMEHNITEDSIVECKVQNSLGMVHDLAYITVRPGQNSYCQSYSTILPKSSACYPFIKNIANEYKEPYLISQSRLYSNEISNQAVKNLFTSWDDLLSSSMYLSQSNNYLSDSFKSSNTSFIKSNHVVDTISLSNSSTAAWRCINLAKHLTCATSYPRCEITNADRKSTSLFTNSYIEYPVCLKHCLAVTGLFCFSSLKILNNSALDSLLDIPQNESLMNFDFVKTGWSELINVPEAKSQSLPLSFSDPLGNGKSNPFHICSSIKSDIRSSEQSKKSICTRLPIDNEIPTNFIEESKKTPDEKNVDCINGKGENYRGLATMPECKPWTNVLVLDDNIQNLQPGIWPGFYSLNSFTFPRSLGLEASSSAVCRNPSGLASRPFCLSRKENRETFPDISIKSKPNHLEKWYLTSCYQIPQCSETSNNSDYHHNWTLGGESVRGLEITESQLQTIIACSVVGLILCLLIIGCIIWLINRCSRKNIENSDIHFSQLDFDKPQITDVNSVNKESDDNRQFSEHLYDSTEINKEKYLERRRKLLTRRRRLRQLNPCLQCIFGTYYRIVDFTHSSHTTNQSHSVFAVTQYTDDKSMSSIPNQNVVTDVCRSRYLSSLCPCFYLSNFRKKSKHDSLKMIKSVYSCSVTKNELIDEEFEANTLGMRMDKSIVYVTNVPTIISPPKTIDSLPNICVSCGVASNLLSDTCSSCRYTQNKQTGVSSAVTTNHPVSGDSCSNNHVLIDDHEVDSEFSPTTLGLIESSYYSLSSGSAELGSAILPEKLFNVASMNHLLHPKFKSLCYPRNRLVEIRCLAKRAFGWIILVHAPNLNKLVHRRRLLSLTTSERLGLVSSSSQEKENTIDVQSSSDESSDCIAVLKMIQGGANLKAEANFLREAEILVELQHRNIIQLLGVCIPLEPLSLLIEYMPFGDFYSFLRRYDSESPGYNCFVGTANGEIVNAYSQTLSQTTTVSKKDFTDQCPTKLNVKMLAEMVIDACEAMVYLSEMHYVHRDVATRSFLVGKKLIIKLSDFSMCRPIQSGVDFISTSNECLPIKWLPLESILDGKFHIDTDVWSFGVLLWEVFSYAVEPFTDLSHTEIIKLLEQGDRLTRPSQCPESVYQLMLKCWSADRTERPKFIYIRNCLKEIFKDL